MTNASNSNNSKNFTTVKQVNGVTKENRHVPVLLSEVIEGLRLEAGMTVVDATLGNAGHAEVIAGIIGKTGHLVGFDADPLAIAESTKILANSPPKITIVNQNFDNLSAELVKLGINQVDAVLMDLGLRRGSLEDTGRGFSFQQPDEPLDMRFNPFDATLVPASEIVNEYSAETLADLFYYYADERLSRRYAAAIVEARKYKEIKTVGDLVTIIDGATPRSATRPGKNPATKVFQALRMTVNRELEVLAAGIELTIQSLRVGGRLAIISFHSIEDRKVKNLLRELEKTGTIKRDPKKAIKPSRAEVISNRLSRSAVLRLVTKI